MSNIKDLFTGIDRRLWQLTCHIMLRWNTICPFIWRSFNVPNQTRGLILFLVPKNSTFRYEIETFLQKELEDLKSDDVVLDDTKIPGTDVEIHCYIEPFETITPYTTSEQNKKIANEMMIHLRTLIKDDNHDTKKS